MGEISKKNLPTSRELVPFVIEAIKSHGGRASSMDIDLATIKLLGLPNELIELLHGNDENGRTEIRYRIAWARTYASKKGLIEKSAPREWSLTAPN